MKKILGILGVAVIAVAMFFNANNLTGFNNDINLTSLVNFNSANAEGTSGTYWVKKHFDCTITVTGSAGAKVTVWGQEVTIPTEGKITLSSNVGVDCDIDGPSQCTVFDCNQLL